ncbi:MAG: hypothetical protein Q8P13_04035 [bacterium]|nr:hypothetical protein [bacterium]
MTWIRERFTWVFILAMVVFAASFGVNKPVFDLAAATMVLAVFSLTTDTQRRKWELIPVALTILMIVGTVIWANFFVEDWGFDNSAKIMF